MAARPRPAKRRPSGDGGDREHVPSLSHVLSLRVLLGVWTTLVVLTGVTVAATHVDLGSMNLWTALAIATLKASLVALYFMHLRYDRPVNLIIFLGTLFFVCLFVGLALIDTQSYQGDLIPGYAPAMPH
jgi:cytochrome c oxidase subunit IV